MKKIEINIPHDQPIALALVEAFKKFSESINTIAGSITAAIAAPPPGAMTTPAPAAPPPAATAPAAPPPAATAPAAPTGILVELDKAGMPWDARIHAGSKARLKKTDLWRKKKGVDATLVTQVEAELKATMAAPAPAPAAAELVSALTPAPAAPPPAATAPAAPPPAATAPVEVKYNVDGKEFTRDQLIGAGWTDEQVDALTEIIDITFPVLMQHITNGVTMGHFTDEQVNQIVADAGVASLALLAARPDLIPTVYNKLFDE